MTDDEVAVPDDDGLQDASGRGDASSPEDRTPPRVECERDGVAVGCVRWVHRLDSASSAPAMHSWWLEATPERLVARDPETVVALSRSSGRLLWQRELDAVGQSWHLGDEVVAVQTPRTTRALSLGDGTERWSVDEGGLAMLGPRGTADTIHTTVVEDDHSVLVARATDGTVRWRHALPAGRDSGRPWHPQVTQFGPLTFVLLEGPQQDRPLVAIDGDDGTERWRRVDSRPVHAAGDTAVVLDLDRVVEERDDGVSISESPTALVGVDATDGSERWRYDLTDGHPQVHFVQGVVVMDDEDGITGLDMATGEALWHTEGHQGEHLVSAHGWWGPPRHSPGEPDVLMSFVDPDGLVIARDPATGELLWRTQFEQPAGHLTTLGGTIVARTVDASFVQLDASTGEVRGTVTVETDGEPTFVADDVLVDREAGWVVGIDLAGAQ